LQLAEKWDNVGLLVEPTQVKIISSILLTNDLTEIVLEEAINIRKVQLIISYHPPLFDAIKQLRSNNVKQRIILKCIENGIVIYSPHTALDSVNGCVNDWLADGLGEGTRVPITPHDYQTSINKVILYFSVEEVDVLKQLTNIGAHNFFVTPSSLGESKVELLVPKNKNSEVYEIVKKIKGKQKFCWESFPVDAEPNSQNGVGRIVTLHETVKLPVLIDRVKKLLGLRILRVATAKSDIKTIAICAGSGGSVLKGVKADAYVTGEMAHHDILAATARGTTVILCGHSNTERGYLYQCFSFANRCRSVDYCLIKLIWCIYLFSLVGKRGRFPRN